MYLPRETITVFSFHCSALSHFHFYFHSAASCLAGIASRDESIVSISLKNSAWRLVNGDHLETSSYFPSHCIENLWMDVWMNEWMKHLVSHLISPMKAFEFPTLGIMLLGTKFICKGCNGNQIFVIPHSAMKAAVWWCIAKGTQAQQNNRPHKQPPPATEEFFESAVEKI